ncbi:hypothetical protein JK364_27325 [Streptomyces sp. 110]|uniref:Glucose-methanol-choline oxidoreductase C-terminal domain-containing protein n=1 Tax=Streptomyces endocoffeicus TaxID=2898945 RepID=A0ABS1PUI5_9ACTN|nr:GMC oxidoreductase [Streptomyces endocoffeicus]MBL1116087.1 hypothetical protein [Streptomyces endocoffeicus]
MITPGPDITSETETCARKATGTSYHPSDTCRMGVGANTGLDPEGRMSALSGPRVVDASIMPKVITGNLNVPGDDGGEARRRIVGCTPMKPSETTHHSQPTA